MRDGTGKFPTPNSHVDDEYDTETMVYNRKMNRKKKRRNKKKKKKKENKGGLRNTTVERKEKP